MIRAADLFCGAGGTSIGAESTGAAKVVFAVNHWDRAIETHSANFPGAKHVNSRLDQVNPGECGKIDLLFASPECTHHSRARGGRPTSDQQRSGAWDVMRWIEYHRPSYVVVENVREFADWGPVGDNGRPLKSLQGKFFDAWRMAIQAAGYTVDQAVLNAADFGAATSRERLFVVARKGNRYPRFPDPSHARRVGGEFPGMGLQRWKSAAEVIDWSIPCRSVFLRTKPLADKTLARIEAGLRRLVGPFVTKLRNNATAESLGSPVSTVTAGGGHHGMTVPFLAQWDQQSGTRGFASTGEPLGTVVTKANRGVAVPFVMSTLTCGAARAIHHPTPTLTAHGGVFVGVPFLSSFHGGPDLTQRNYDTQNRFAVTVPFMVSYYGNGEALDVGNPLGTVTCKDRCGLVYAVVEACPSIVVRSEGERRLLATMQALGVADIGFRMLANHELSAAQGFPSNYHFSGSKADVKKQIGNSVSPPVAAAITRTLAG